MRKWILILLTSLCACCCYREEVPETDQEDPQGRVSFTFTLTAEQAPTKALGEAYELNTVNIAVFGGSGYLKEYQTVTPVYKGNNQYECTISLALTNSKRRVHILGNGPTGISFGRDYDVLPPILGEEGATGYWQLVLLDKVTAKQDDQGNLIEPFEASDELLAAFQNVPLIRNWAKIELVAQSDSHFTPYSFAVINAPKRGTIVPYGGQKGFITNYKDLSFAQLQSDEYDYTGNLPTSKTELIPMTLVKDDFVNMTNGVTAYKAAQDLEPGETPPAVYLYERPIPDGSIAPTSLLVYGKYYNPSDTSLSPEEKSEGVECFYKLDLMAGGEYYPILRNFRYTIQIENIAARGQDTPEEAAASAGSADVSADVNASHLPDISDGTRRMAIQPWMSYAFLEAQEETTFLYVTFYDDINQGEGGDDPEPNMEPESVYYQLIPETAGIIKDGQVTIGAAQGKDELGNKPSNYGWRPISFAIAGPSEARARTQTLRILCKTHRDDPNETPLYRDVVISLLPIQTMRVSCGEERILRKKGTEVRVDVDIPDGLVESMFPLDFYIEARNLTLTPDDSQREHVLPVVSGQTLVDNSGRQSFYFQRTVTWSEYTELTSHLDLVEESRWRTFSSYFKTNCDDSRTEVYVANRYFETGMTHFDNIESFSNPRFSTSIPYTAGGAVTVSASMMSDQDLYETVYLELHNLEPVDDNWTPVTTGQFSGRYAYTPTSKDMSFNLRTTADGGDVSVTLSTESGAYEPITLVPWHFSNVGFIDAIIMPGKTSIGDHSNVIWGHVNCLGGSKQVLLGYNTDPDNMHPKVRLIDNGGELTIPSAYTSASGYDTSTQHTNYAGQDNFHWAALNTKNGSTDNVSLTLSAVGYVEQSVTAGRYSGDAYVLDMGATQIAAFLEGGGEYAHDVTVNGLKGRFSLRIVSDNEQKVPVAHDASGGFLLPAGGHYRWEAQITSDHGDVFLYYVQVTYYYDSENEALLRPRSAEPEQDECNYFRYLGNYKDYIWNLSSRAAGGSLMMNAYSDKDIVVTRIILRGFHGKVYGDGDAGNGDIGFGDKLGDGGKL